MSPASFPWRQQAKPLVFFLTVLLLIGFTIKYAIAQHGAFPDDVYITWRCARNFAEGFGLSYNRGENYLGTSGPGYAILLGLFAKIFGTIQIPIISEAISSVAILATSLGLLIGFWKRGFALLGMVASALYISIPFVRSAYGFEVLLQLACVVWAYNAYLYAPRSKRMRTLCIALLAFAIFIRPDGVVWALPIVLYDWFATYQSSIATNPSIRKLSALFKSFPIADMAAFVALILVGVLIVRWASGQVIPSTYEAKEAQRQSMDWPTYLDGGLKWLQTQLAISNPLVPKLLWLAAGGLMFSGYHVLSKKNVLLGLLLSGALIHFAIYVAKLPFYGWYFAPEGLAAAMLAALAISLSYNAMESVLPFAGIIILVPGAWLVYDFANAATLSAKAEQFALANSEKVRTYNAFGQWLKEHTKPRDSVGLCEVGIVGWVSDRPIVDQFFLVSPGEIDSIQRHIYDKSFKDAQPTYIAESPLLFGTMRGHPWFWKNYEFLTSFPDLHSTPMSASETEDFRKRGKLEIDIWKHRDTPLNDADAATLAKGYVRNQRRKEPSSFSSS